MANDPPTNPVELAAQHIADLEKRPTRNADLPPPYLRDFTDNNFQCLPDTDPPISENIRGKLRTLSNLVQEMIVPLRYELKAKQVDDNLQYILGKNLHELETDYIHNRIRILEDYNDDVINTMIQFEDYTIQNPEFIFDLSKFELPRPAPTGFENDMNVIEATGNDNLQSVILTILEKIQFLEKNIDIRVQNNTHDTELQVKKGQLLSVRLILESIL